MPDLSRLGNSARAENTGFDLSTTRGQVVTANSTADTVGSNVELVSAANNDFTSNWCIVKITSADNISQPTFLVNIEVGAASSEVTLIPNLLHISSSDTDRDNHYTYEFPLHIPAGVRISANCQSSIGSEVCYVSMVRMSAPMAGSAGFGKVLAIGADTTNTKGTNVARSSANTFGSWVQITSSLSNACKGFVVAAARQASSWSNGRNTYKVGVGASSSEQEVFGGDSYQTCSSEQAINAVSPFIPVRLSEGDRITIAAQSNISNTDQDFDYIIYIVL